MYQQEIYIREEDKDVAILISVPKAALMLGISNRQVYALASQEIIPGVVHIGRSVRIRKKDFYEWIDAGCKGA